MLDGRGRVKITDFGLAGLHETFEQGEIRSGTPAYMAPEQLAGKEVTARSDIYSLGLVLYELFTGKPAFEASSPTEMARLHSDSRPSSPSSHVEGFDPTVEQAILRCLEEDPRNRPSSATMLLAGALAAYAFYLSLGGRTLLRGDTLDG
jgi:serine/threonine-protein kinase